jgi:ABC-type uncharacterized transport system YnjBCD substrate-binding protein
MTPEEQIVKMTKAINQAIKVLSDPFGSSQLDNQRAIQALKESMQSTPPAAPAPAKAEPSQPSSS